ncbi:type IV pilus modification protein PilV [Lysobacter niastensis]|uniref:Type IV pilus modification protein PilV n=1 Tax=Lysobacter niastensis TaxID=380629 RepID=A0ABU1W8H8_9GAMM|nr:prepilin-type N-terminal cleavage/methylation domain-containing protein [Lysobacter niastensis]MDR7133883.1 type IV pilus modification protein PilV [Lysobacter niastensis]
MKFHSPNRRARGFSLLEVLIAVVVLSFGLLALAALQSRIFQASAEVKAQSIGLALAKGKLEDMRSFMTMAQYQGLNTGSDSATTVDGTAFTRSWTVKRYAVPVAGGGTTFQQYGTVTGALPAAYAPNREFKTVEMAVTWTDASGQARAVRMEDAIAGIDPQDSARNQRSRSGRSRGPKVLIYDPSTENGVIPIAVGDGTSTAATNPKPVNVSRTGDDAVETRYDVLTYAALSGGNAQAQTRVETSVVGCTCTNTPTTAAAYRPTYWNGTRYAVPEVANYSARARPANGVTQSRYCTACCGSHHDPSGTTEKKFSPRLTTHLHYRLNNGAFEVAGAGDNYLEACRLIRVDGIFDVAADLSNDYTNLLATASSASTPAPGGVAVTNYQNFVLDYLNHRYVVQNPGAQTAKTVYNDRVSPAPAVDATTHQLDSPAELNIAATNDTKWLHARGLYVDYLEQEAVDAVIDAKSSCGSSATPAQLRDCVLRVLPFTSINLTEIAEWTPITGSQVKVTNDDFSTSIAIDTPVRGKVTPGSNPTPNQVTDVFARVGSSNSGIAIFGDISPNEDEQIYNPDVTGFWRDQQAFRVSNNSGGGQPGGTFYVSFGNYAIASNDPPQAGFTYGTRSEPCSGSHPVPCTTQQGENLPSALTVRVGNYNKSGTIDIPNPCRNNGNTTMPYRVDFDVTAFTSSNGSATFTSVAGTVINPNEVGVIPIGEYTEVGVSTIAQNDTITATFGGPTYLCPSNYPSPGGNSNNPDSRYQCTGNGSNAAPNWSTTWVACPSQSGVPTFP